MVVGWKLGSGFRVRGSGFRWRLRRNYKGGDAQKPFSPSFLWKEAARSAGGWLDLSRSATPYLALLEMASH